MATEHPHYFVPEPSKWPLVGATALFLIGFGAAFSVNQWPIGYASLLLGIGVLIYMLIGWFSDVIGESQRGIYSKQVDASFRWGMGWFIFSEIMFFIAFFGTLFYLRQITLADLSSFNNRLLWPGFNGLWPLNVAPQGVAPYQAVDAWGLPALNTLLLLSSGATLTWGHWGLLANNRKQLIGGLSATVALGLLFLLCQALEYHHAFTALHLNLASGVYGSTFYMMTGFHGLHVFIGALMLIVVLIRAWRGHFQSQHHFAFEAAAWYWHFVDVVWLILFVFIYWL